MNVQNSILNNKYGCWIASGVPFISKLEALNYASQTGIGKVSFYYHDHIWEKYDRSLLGKISLETIYKERAQQLRDRYNYLILHYSGGSDSHNILYTFLKNNIKLDEIRVRWIKPLQDGKLYVPNRADTSARNAASEWDFSIKPTLDWIKINRPEIKINVLDYSSTNTKENLISVENAEKRILDMNINRGGLGTFSMWVDPDLELKILPQNKKNIGHMFGIEKPILFIRDNYIYFQFMDSVFESALLPEEKKENRVEIFYWSPDYPLLPMEQAYQSALYFKNNLYLKDYMISDTSIGQNEAIKKFQDQGFIHKKVLYSESWDNSKFQVNKPNVLRSDWYFWLYEEKEMFDIKKNWETALNNITSGIDDRFLVETDTVNFLRPIKTKLFPILKLTD